MKLLFFLFPKDERSIWLELNILLIFFPKNSKIRVWARLTSNFNTWKSNFVRNCMELLFITNMLSNPSYARPYLTFEYFYHKLLHVIFIVIIYQSQRFYVKYFILLNSHLCSSLLRVCIINHSCQNTYCWRLKTIYRYAYRISTDYQ